MIFPAFVNSPEHVVFGDVGFGEVEENFHVGVECACGMGYTSFSEF